MKQLSTKRAARVLPSVAKNNKQSIKKTPGNQTGSITNINQQPT